MSIFLTFIALVTAGGGLWTLLAAVRELADEFDDNAQPPSRTLLDCLAALRRAALAAASSLTGIALLITTWI